MEMVRFGLPIAGLAAALAWGACSLIVTAEPERDAGGADDGVEEPAEADADAEAESDAQEDASAEDLPADELPPPPGWIECPDLDGSSVWIRLMTADMSHDTWSVAEDDCLRAIGGQDYFHAMKTSSGYVEGLARIVDESVFACLEDAIHLNHDTCLNPDSETDTCYYHVGLVQGAGEAEPSSGWHWTGYRDGSAAPENLGPLDADHVAGIEDDFDDTCCSGSLEDSDCGLLKVRRVTDSWSYWFIDFKCVDACVPFQGICMIAFMDGG